MINFDNYLQRYSDYAAKVAQANANPIPEETLLRNSLFKRYNKKNVSRISLVRQEGPIADLNPKLLTGFGARAGEASPAVKTRLAELILQAAADLPFEDKAILLSIAEHESGLNPEAKNPSSTAYGVFQIINRTWKGLGYKEEGRKDALSQIKAGVDLYRENLRILNKQQTRIPSSTQKLIEMYTLHHDGPSGIDYGGRAIAKEKVLPRFRNVVATLSPFVGDLL